MKAHTCIYSKPYLFLHKASEVFLCLDLSTTRVFILLRISSRYLSSSFFFSWTSSSRGIVFPFDSKYRRFHTSRVVCSSASRFACVLVKIKVYQSLQYHLAYPTPLINTCLHPPALTLACANCFNSLFWIFFKRAPLELNKQSFFSISNSRGVLK